MTIHLNIGSNIGNRMALIGRAVALLCGELRPCAVRVSAPVETEPWGFDSPNTFINIGVRIKTDTGLSPTDVLAVTRRVEREVGAGCPHRNPDGSYRDRPIDIDIIAIDRLVIDTAELVIPHPRAHLRDFVLVPLARLDPATRDWIVTRSGSAQS